MLLWQKRCWTLERLGLNRGYKKAKPRIRGVIPASINIFITFEKFIVPLEVHSVSNKVLFPSSLFYYFWHILRRVIYVKKTFEVPFYGNYITDISQLRSCGSSCAPVEATRRVTEQDCALNCGLRNPFEFSDPSLCFQQLFCYRSCKLHLGVMGYGI